MPAALITDGLHRQMRVQRYEYFDYKPNISGKMCTFAPKFNIRERKCRIYVTLRLSHT